MVQITLYGIDPSPPVRAVKLTLAALGLPYKFELVNVLKQEQHNEEYLKKNPQHTIPMLEDGDATIWDSHAIISYLVSKYGKDDSLYPKDLLKRAVVDQRLHFETGVVFTNAFRSITRMVVFQGAKEVPQARIDAIVEVYDFLETFLKEHNYVAGDKLTIADLSLIATTSTLGAYVKVDSAKYPKLTAWMKRLEQLPYYEENAKGAKQFTELVHGLKYTVVA